MSAPHTGQPDERRTRVAFLATPPLPCTVEGLSARLLADVPAPDWPESNGPCDEELEVRAVAQYGMELVLDVARLVHFEGTNPVFDGPWTLTRRYEVIVPATADAPLHWTPRPP